MSAMDFIDNPIREISQKFQKKHASNEIYLEYQDIHLTYEDYQILKEGGWFTDNLISFYEVWLEEHLLQTHDVRMILLRPSMTQVLLYCQDLEEIRQTLPDFGAALHIGMFVNNAPNAEEAGGTHWSYLHVCKDEGVALHFDSLSSNNATEAVAVTKRLQALLARPLNFVWQQDMPQQQNTEDCGVYACVTMEFIIEGVVSNAERGEPNNEWTLSMSGWDINPKKSRKEMLENISRIKHNFFHRLHR